jgi:hypothetical protein
MYILRACTYIELVPASGWFTYLVLRNLKSSAELASNSNYAQCLLQASLLVVHTLHSLKVVSIVFWAASMCNRSAHHRCVPSKLFPLLSGIVHYCHMYTYIRTRCTWTWQSMQTGCYFSATSVLGHSSTRPYRSSIIESIYASFSSK